MLRSLTSLILAFLFTIAPLSLPVILHPLYKVMVTAARQVSASPNQVGSGLHARCTFAPCPSGSSQSFLPLLVNQISTTAPVHSGEMHFASLPVDPLNSCATTSEAIEDPSVLVLAKNRDPFRMQMTLSDSIRCWGIVSKLNSRFFHGDLCI